MAGQSCHILTSAIEHPATLRSLEQLHQDGMIQYSTVLPEHSGWIDPKRVESMIRSDTRLISIMSANNETGIIQPLPEIADLARSRVIAIHSDMVQSLGKINLRFDDLQLDFASFAAHKIYGPKGIGALAFREKGDLIPLLHGGGQEMGLRAGTENTAGIVGFGAAAALCREFLPEEATRITRLRDQFEEQLKKKIDGLHILGADQARLPGTSCICFEALLGTYLVQDLAAEGLRFRAALPAGWENPNPHISCWRWGSIRNWLAEQSVFRWAASLPKMKYFRLPNSHAGQSSSCGRIPKRYEEPLQKRPPSFLPRKPPLLRYW
ncbi:MAG: aminotransferase class V-fold PLP-dependent enzyme [Candidatus Omnitrophica bacterium]|nr:aminotransferase class V-fold PLP-dependent enzyme [Candidatus Omnitrophota bacterium]